MALIICPECGKQVSDTCRACIHCGYSLVPGSVTPNTPNRTGRGFGKRGVLAVSLAILLIAAGIAATLIFTLGNNSNGDDPFSALHGGQSRESVHEKLGKPDVEENIDPDEKHSWNIDEYNKVRFLKGWGELRVWYDDDNKVSHAFFEYYYYGDSDSEKERVYEYSEQIIDFYTEKYGDPEKSYLDTYDLLWNNKRGGSIDFGYEDGSDGCVGVRIFWNP